MGILGIDSIQAGYGECFNTKFDFVVSDEEENDVVIKRKSNQVSVLCVYVLSTTVDKNLCHC